MSYLLYNPDQYNYPYNPWDGTQKQRKNISYTDHADYTNPITYVDYTDPVMRSGPKCIPVYIMP